jgi:hypothetical protein
LLTWCWICCALLMRLPASAGGVLLGPAGVAPAGIWYVCAACPADRLALLGLWKRSLLGAIMFSRGL